MIDRPSPLDRTSLLHPRRYALRHRHRDSQDHPTSTPASLSARLQEITNYSGLTVPDGVAISTERLYEVANGDGTTTAYRLMRVNLADLVKALPTALRPPTDAPQRTASRQQGDSKPISKLIPTADLPPEPSECAPTDSDCLEWLKLTAERLQRDRETRQVIRDEIAYGRLEVARRVLGEIVNVKRF